VEALRTTKKLCFSTLRALEKERALLSPTSERSQVGCVSMSILSLVGRANDLLEPLVLKDALTRAAQPRNQFPDHPFHWVFGLRQTSMACQTAAHGPETGLGIHVDEFQAHVQELKTYWIRGTPLDRQRALLGAFMERTGPHLATVWLGIGLRHANIEDYFNAWHRDVAAEKEDRIDPALTGFCHSLACAKHKAADNALGVMCEIGDVVAELRDSIQEQILTPHQQSSRINRLEVLGLALHSYLLISEPTFVGRLRNVGSPEYREMYGLENRAPASNRPPGSGQPEPAALNKSLIARRLDQPDLLNLSMRATTDIGRFDPDLDMHLEFALEKLGVPALDAILIAHGHVDQLRQEMKVLKGSDGSRFGIYRYKGQVLSSGDISLDIAAPNDITKAQAHQHRNEARRELADKGTALGSHDLAKVLKTKGVEFISIEDSAAAVLGFAYMYVDPDHFPDKDSIGSIDRSLLPAGCAARPSFIVLSPSLKAALGKGVAYKAMLDTLENIARDAKANYLISMYNTAPESRGGPAAMAWGFRPIPAFRTVMLESEHGTAKPVLYQWMVKEIEKVAAAS